MGFYAGACVCMYVTGVVCEGGGGWDARRLRAQSSSSLLDTVLAMQDGLVLAKLLDIDGVGLHMVGIDCSTQSIYDCAEQSILPLSKANLDHCTGTYSLCTGISLARVLVPRKAKKQRVV